MSGAIRVGCAAVPRRPEHPACGEREMTMLSRYRKAAVAIVTAVVEVVTVWQGELVCAKS